MRTARASRRSQTTPDVDGAGTADGDTEPGWLSRTLEAEQAQWFIWTPVLAGAGISLYFSLREEPSPVFAAALLLAGLTVRLLAGRSLITLLAASATIWLGFGLAIAQWRAHAVASPVMAFPTGRVTVTGWIALVEARPDRTHRITVAVRTLGELPLSRRPGKIRVRVRNSDTPLTAGVLVEFDARLLPPAEPAMPGGYDFARSAWFQQIGAVGYTVGPVRAHAAKHATQPDHPDDQRDGFGPEPIPWWLGLVAARERVREVIGRRVAAVLPGDTGAIATALLNGERGGIGEEINKAYRDSGLFHILSISGLHMSIMGGTVFFLVRLLLALVPAVALKYPVKKWAAIAAAATAAAYLAVSGSAHPAIRSWLMISIMLLAVLLGRPALALRNVALAALVMLVAYPESVLDIGFQMSFAAVVALISGYEFIRRERQLRDDGRARSAAWFLAAFLGGIVLSTVIASLAVAPFAAYHFHKSQQYAVLANLVAIPICNLLVMPAALLALLAMPLGLEWTPLVAMGHGIEAMTWCARSVAGLPGAVAAVPAIPRAAFACFLLGGVWLTLWQTRWRLAGLLIIAMGLALSPFEPRPDVLVARTADMIATRGEDGRLQFAGAVARRTFDAEHWLARDGDARTPAKAAAGSGASCGEDGCVVTLPAKTSPTLLRIALARTTDELDLACTRHAIVVTPTRLDRPVDANRPAVEASAMPRIASTAAATGHAHSACPSAVLVIDRTRALQFGALELHITPNHVDMVTTRAVRGKRPWVREHHRAAGVGHRPARRPHSRDERR